MRHVPARTTAASYQTILNMAAKGGVEGNVLLNINIVSLTPVWRMRDYLILIYLRWTGPLNWTPPTQPFNPLNPAFRADLPESH